MFAESAYISYFLLSPRWEAHHNRHVDRLLRHRSQLVRLRNNTQTLSTYHACIAFAVNFVKYPIPIRWHHHFRNI